MPTSAPPRQGGRVGRTSGGINGAFTGVVEEIQRIEDTEHSEAGTGADRQEVVDRRTQPLGVLVSHVPDGTQPR